MHTAVLLIIPDSCKFYVKSCKYTRESYIKGCSVYVANLFCYLELPGIFPPNIFHPLLVESRDRESTDTEAQLFSTDGP